MAHPNLERGSRDASSERDDATAESESYESEAYGKIIGAPHDAKTDDDDFNGAPELAGVQESQTWEGADVLDGFRGRDARAQSEGKESPPDAIRRADLERRSAELLERLEVSRPGLAAREDGAAPLAVDGTAPSPDAADELETVQDLEAQIARIDRALARLDTGEYGQCLSCGAAFAVEVLDEQPERELCSKCVREVRTHS